MTTRAERRAFDRARDLDRQLKLTQVRTLSRTLGGSLVHATQLARRLAGALGHARDLALVHDLAFIRDIDCAIDLNLHVTDVLAYALACGPILTHGSDLGRVRTLERALNSARVLAPDLGPDLDLDLGRAIASVAVLARDLERALSSVRVAARDVIAAGEEAMRHDKQADQTQTGSQADPARSAVRITRVASGLLPRRDRARYAEEYRAELADLAAAGHGRWRQLGHAGRLLGRTGALRLALAWAHQRRRKAA